MGPRDIWRRRRDDEPLPDEVQAEVEAVDAILRGSPPPEGMEDLGDLIRDLRADRPAPDQRFAAGLDEWAAEGFDRAKRPAKPIERPAPPHFRVLPGRSMVWRLAPAGALAATVLVALVAVSQMDDGADDQAGSGVVADQEAPAESQAPSLEAEAEEGGGAELGGAPERNALPSAAEGVAAQDSNRARRTAKRIVLEIPGKDDLGEVARVTYPGIPPDGEGRLAFSVRIVAG